MTAGICLSVSKITRKVRNRLSRNVQEVLIMGQKTEDFLVMFVVLLNQMYLIIP